MKTKTGKTNMDSIFLFIDLLLLPLKETLEKRRNNSMDTAVVSSPHHVSPVLVANS